MLDVDAQGGIIGIEVLGVRARSTVPVIPTASA